MASERRKGERVVFERGFPAHMMGIDGTWRRECTMEDVSETGAKLTIEGTVEGLHLKEFFLLLSSTGLAYRRCELAWVNGDQIGVNFLKQGDKKKSSRRAGQARRGLMTAAIRRRVVMSSHLRSSATQPELRFAAYRRKSSFTVVKAGEPARSIARSMIRKHGSRFSRDHVQIKQYARIPAGPVIRLQQRFEKS